MNWILLLFLSTSITASDVGFAVNDSLQKNNSDNMTQGDPCTTKDGQDGVCRAISRCNSAIMGLSMKRKPEVCFFEDLEAVVCCFDEALPVATPINTEFPPTTAEYMPPDYDYVSNYKDTPDGCEPIPSRLTSQKSGRKAWDKCIEYQSKYVYVCEKRMALGENHIRVNYCGHDTDKFRSEGGNNAKKGEFPHMVLLGYGENVEKAKWLCGGTILSEIFIMTSAACVIIPLKRSEIGPLKYVRAATYRTSDQLDLQRVYNVKRTIVHPQYIYNRLLNDIALIETDTRMVLDGLAVPACLPLDKTYNDTLAEAIGFGATLTNSRSDYLKKVVLSKFSTEECAEKYNPRLVKLVEKFGKVIQASNHLCYGDKVVAKDTCKGDTGGPLHIHNPDVHCMFTVIGVISFGVNSCSLTGFPGVYTNVATYTPWIESHIWPDESAHIV